MKSVLSISLLFGSVVYGHGIVTGPKARAPGPAMAAVCGQQATNGMMSDQYGNIQQEVQNAQNSKDFNAASCNFFLCKGFQLQDNMANVQTFSPGQTVPITAEIRAPHTGTCNVSVVDTTANAIIGQPLITFADYASTSHPIPANNTKFSITMPTDLGGKCTTAGDCVVQWWWDSPEAKQTYESCIDFTMGGSAPPPTKRAPSSSAITMTASTSTSSPQISGGIAQNAAATDVVPVVKLSAVLALVSLVQFL